MPSDTALGGWIVSSHTKFVGDRGAPSRILRWSDVTARASWARDRLALNATVGVRPELATSPRLLWGRATATIAMASRLSLVTSAGRDATRLWLGGPATRFVSLGLRVARGCSYHGIALNVDLPLEPFGRIDPCGFPGLESTSLAALGVRDSIDAVQQRLGAAIERALAGEAVPA